MEIELKLLLASEDLARVLSSQAVRRRAKGRTRRSELVSVYMDSPGFDLHRQGLALRLRQSGERWLQALKSGAHSAAGLTEREEYEWPVSGRRLDFSLLQATPYGSLFSHRRLRDALRPVFSTRFLRQARQLELVDGTLAELCVDAGELRCGTRRALISEVEIELKAGNPAALYEFAAELLRELPLRLGFLSKAERGYAIASKALLHPHKTTPVALRPEMNQASVIQSVARACLTQVHANEDGFLAGRDPEFLHQLRIGLRRLRAALAMAEDPDWRGRLEPIQAEMRWLFSVLGPARNWDVFVAELLPPLMRHFPDDESLAAFRRRCLRLRRQHIASARDAIAGKRYQTLMLSLGILLYAIPQESAYGGSEPARQFGDAVIERRNHVLQKRAADLLHAGAEARHRARVAAKKLRYCSEYFASLHPQKKVRRFVRALADLQDLLGAINDAAVTSRLLTQMQQSTARSDTRVAGLVQGWISAGEAHALTRLGRIWKRFDACKPFWEQ